MEGKGGRGTAGGKAANGASWRAEAAGPAWPARRGGANVRMCAGVRRAGGRVCTGQRGAEAKRGARVSERASQSRFVGRVRVGPRPCVRARARESECQVPGRSEAGRERAVQGERRVRAPVCAPTPGGARRGFREGRRRRIVQRRCGRSRHGGGEAPSELDRHPRRRRGGGDGDGGGGRRPAQRQSGGKPAAAGAAANRISDGRQRDTHTHTHVCVCVCGGTGCDCVCVRTCV